MRQHDVRDIFHGLLAGSVFRIHVRAELELLHGLQSTEVVFIDDARTRAIDNQRIGLHKIQQAGVDQAACRVIFRNMQRDDVGFFEDVLKRAHRRADGFRAFRRNQRIVGQNLHIETACALRDQLADVAETDDTDRLARQFAAHELLLFPTAGARRDVAGDHMTVNRQSQSDHFLRHRVRVRAGRVHDIDVLLAGVLDVDRVETSTRADDRLKLWKQINDFRRDFLTADDQRLTVRMRFDKIQYRSVRILDNLIAVRLKQFSCNRIQFRRNQYFFHGNQSFLLSLTLFRRLSQLRQAVPSRPNQSPFINITSKQPFYQ